MYTSTKSGAEARWYALPFIFLAVLKSCCDAELHQRHKELHPLLRLLLPARWRTTPVPRWRPPIVRGRRRWPIEVRRRRRTPPVVLRRRTPLHAPMRPRLIVPRFHPRGSRTIPIPWRARNGTTAVPVRIKVSARRQHGCKQKRRSKPYRAHSSLPVLKDQLPTETDCSKGIAVQKFSDHLFPYNRMK